MVKARSKTRDKVLEVALALLNARGPDRVTTAEIAEAAGINEGNLYYYFQRKEQLVEALFGMFADSMIRVAECQVENPAEASAYALYQRGWFDLMWAFRFFYRDGMALRALPPGLRTRMTAMNARGQAAVQLVFRQMRANGFLAASDEEIVWLVGNVWIVSSYWMDFRGTTIATPDDLAWGYRQVEALYAPYLTEHGRRIARPITHACRELASAQD